MSVTVSVSGLRELEAQLANLSRAAGKGALRRALHRAAKPLAELAASKAPERSGALKGSIIVGAKLNGRQTRLHRRLFRDDRAAVELFVGPSYLRGDGGRHGHLVEFGTLHMAAQPFLRPAWDQDREALLERLRADLWQQVSKAVARAEKRAARAAAKRTGS
ncbi:HK97 gp10 family phage protein [Cereibacter sphaeroides]|uniref:HK97-gp10 family putative phage morphogenesis protein n=1 Tax=Cereibacter sphaeroides TaxID=1063 RepID=UPI000F533C86|nr:HK97-gp10 family putative phage morphogenesis protein [Cereibacter sphaeroides]AZB56549.1 HK97 gp10 family phage protein [Cereibacter sphaeroides]AZB60812.1 HK97 gp10 family phage protein [Cereibacter sphaeroides]